MSGFMHVLITTIHVLACVALMVAILLQSGRGGGLAGAFGAGSSQTLFGGRGAATFLSRAATTLAVVFFLTSLTLGLASARRSAGPGRSLIQEEARKKAGQRGAETAPPMGGGTVPGQGMPAPTQTAPGPAAPGPAGPTQTSAPPAAAPAPVTQPKAPAKQPSKTAPSSGTTQQAPTSSSPPGATQQAPPPEQQQQPQNQPPSGSTTP